MVHAYWFCDHGVHHCSACLAEPAYELDTMPPYCCECGAAMDGEAESGLKFMPGDHVEHYKYGDGVILGNRHMRPDGNYYWHVAYMNGTYGYNQERSLKLAQSELHNTEWVTIPDSVISIDQSVFEMKG